MEYTAGDLPVTRRRYPEYHEQKALIHWAKLNASRYPDLKRLCAIPNGAHVAPTHRQLLVAAGLRPGMPDLFLPALRNGFGGMFIEMKAAKGRLSEQQTVIIDELRQTGYHVIVARSWQAAATELMAYVKGERTRGGGAPQNGPSRTTRKRRAP